MATRIIRRPEDIETLARFVGTMSFPLTVTITKGEGRRARQNRLAQRWYTDISRQKGDETHEQVRARCKLHHGIPILRAENESFRQSYDRVFLNMTYEEKLAAIEEFDLPVTRLMTVKQMSAFMDEVQRIWRGRGFYLTDPEALKYEEEFA